MNAKRSQFAASAICAAIATLALNAAPASGATTTITGADAINGMSGTYGVGSGDTLTLNFSGVGGDRSTDTMGAAIAQTGGNATISGIGTLQVTGGSGDVLGVGNTPGRTINISLGSGGLIDITGGAFVNGGWGGGNWSANVADMNIASGAVFDVWDGGAITVDALTGAGSVQNGSNNSGTRSFIVGVDGGSGTFSGVIGGGTGRAGNNQISLTKSGSGTQILSGNNTYVGTTTVNAGTLQIGAGGTSGSLGTGNVTIAGGATLEFNRSDDYGTTAGQTFSGEGTLLKNGNGNLTMNTTGVNQSVVSGLQNLVINGGTVRTDNWAQWNSNLNLQVNGTGVFEMWNTTTSIGNLSGNGTVKNSANWSGFAPPSAPYATNNLTIAAGNFSGTITDNGIGNGGNTGTNGDTRINLIKTGTGVLSLTGANTYSGSTTVSAGGLKVNGSLGSGGVSVAQNAWLGGSGSIAGAVSVSGSLAPGNSPGVITLGSLVLDDTSTTLIEINGAATRGTDYDGVTITTSNGLTYDGLLSLSFGNGSAFANGTTLDIFSFLGTSSGTLNSVTSSGFYAGTWTNIGGGAFELLSGGQTLTFSQSTGDIVVVPEPGTLALVGLGGLLAAVSLRRRATLIRRRPLSP